MLLFCILLAACVAFTTSKKKYNNKAKCKRSVFLFRLRELTWRLSYDSPFERLDSARVSAAGVHRESANGDLREEIRADDNFTTSDWLRFYGLSGFYFSRCNVDFISCCARDNFRALRNWTPIKKEVTPTRVDGNKKLETFPRAI